MAHIYSLISIVYFKGSAVFSFHKESIYDFMEYIN